MNMAACVSDLAKGPAVTASCAQFLQECQGFITRNAGRKPDEPSTVHDISSLVHLMKCMFSCFAPALEAATKLPQIVAELNERQEEVKVLRNTVKCLANNYNDLIRYSYDQNALIHGVAEGDNETPESLRKSVLSVLSASQFKPKASDLEDVHRLGTRKTDKIRPIVCKFVSRSFKRRVVGEFYRKRNTERAAASTPDAARSIRSPVTNHVPFGRFIDVDVLCRPGTLPKEDISAPERPHPRTPTRKTRLTSRRH